MAWKEEKMLRVAQIFGKAKRKNIKLNNTILWQHEVQAKPAMSVIRNQREKNTLHSVTIGN